MTNAEGEKPTRTYLRRAQRQTQLLETAAGIVERAGWHALTVRALAEHSGTSKQLVYLHFPSLHLLLHKTAWHIFDEVIERTQRAITEQGTDLQQAIAITEQIAYDLPPGRADALSALIAGSALGTPELESMHKEMRAHILDFWSPRVQTTLRLEEPAAQALTWSLVMGFLGMRQMVRDGDISREQGLSTINQIVEHAAMAALAPKT